MKERIKNKSSIIRAIISNYDSNKIKEIKALYTKQGGVDTFYITGYVLGDELESGKNKIVFIEDSVITKNRNIKIEIMDGDMIITKGILRRYKISGTQKSIRAGQGYEFEVTIEDLKKRSETELIKRRMISSTKRASVLIQHQENYALILNKEAHKVDSLDIYKVKRFLNYRSLMFSYLSIVSKFLTSKIEGTTDIYKINKLKEKDIEKVTDTIYENIIEIIKNQENRLQKLESKIVNLKEKSNETKKKDIKKVLSGKIKEKESQLKELKERSFQLERKDICQDTKKILKALLNFRHKIMHYDFNALENLFNNKELCFIKGEKEENLLDLNIFKELEKVVSLKSESNRTYLEESDTINILGATKDAKIISKMYDEISSKKTGFNNFINEMFTIDGEEDSKVKEKFNELFKNRIKKLENEETLEPSQERELEERRFLKKINSAPYSWDIHNLPVYKKLYSGHKTLSQEVVNIVNSIKNKDLKQEITNLNIKILKFKEKMEKITKLNSKYRLQAKMQIAFGYLFEEHNHIDLKDFMTNFNKSKLETESKDYENIYKYIESRDEKIKVGKKEIRVNMNTNNLKKEITKLEGKSPLDGNSTFKFYILVYLLLPTEIRGDFLGFVKKSYYDRKNLELIDYYKQSESSEREKDSEFFHKMRLFEKNSKKFEIIKYSLTEKTNSIENSNNQVLEEQFGEVYKKLNLDSSLKIQEGNKLKRIFDKSIILPFVKYNINLFKFYNDLELLALIRLKKYEKNIEEIISNNESIKKYGYLNFDALIKTFFKKEEETPKKKNIIFYRNNIAHFDWKNLLINPILGESVTNNSNIKLEDIKNELFTLEPFLKSEEKITYKKTDKDEDEYKNLFTTELGFNAFNDLKMALNHLNLNLKKELIQESFTGKVKQEKARNLELLKRYKLTASIKKINGIEVFDLSNDDLEKIISIYKMAIIPENTVIDEEIRKTFSHIDIFLQNKIEKRFKGKKGIIKKQKLKDVNKYVEKDAIRSALFKEGSLLLGIYKKYTIKTLKNEIASYLPLD